MLKKSKLLFACLGMVVCVGLLLALTSCSDSDKESSSPTTSNGSSNGATLVINDPLTKGKTVANAMLSGGVFTSEGYQITAAEGYIGYETTITQNIIIEFDAKGYTVNEPAHLETDPADDVANMLSIHDAPLWTDWREPNWKKSPYCSFRMRKKLYLSGQIGINGMQIKGGCKASGFEIGSYFHWSAVNEGEWTDNWGFGNAVSWDPAKKYHWKVSLLNGRTEIYRDGTMLGWGDGFLPQSRLVVYIGGADWNHEGVFSPDNVTYANVKIYRVP